MDKVLWSDGVGVVLFNLYGWYKNVILDEVEMKVLYEDWLDVKDGCLWLNDLRGLVMDSKRNFFYLFEKYWVNGVVGVY